jgi:MFS family permease
VSPPCASDTADNANNSGVGVFQDYYQRKLLSSYSPSTIAWIPSLEIFMMFAGGPVYGKIFDDYGPRYLLGIGSFFHVFGLMMTSNASQYYQILLGQGICSSLGSSAVFYAATSSLATWFFQRRALAFGITAAGSSVGGVIFPILVQRLIPQVGFPWAMRTAAFLILFMLIIANLTLKSRLAPNPRRFDIMDFIRPMKELPFDVVMLASFLTFFGIFIPFNYIILQAQAAGMSQELSSYILAIVNGVSVFGRTIPGYLGDKMGRFNVISIMNLMAGIMVLAVWIPARNNVGIIVFGAFYGFFSGAFVSMIPACIAQISDIRQIGVRTGTIYAITSAAALCGNPVAGALVGSGGNFLHLQIFCGVTIVAGSVAFVSARVVLVGPKLLEKC